MEIRKGENIGEPGDIEFKKEELDESQMARQRNGYERAYVSCGGIRCTGYADCSR